MGAIPTIKIQSGFTESGFMVINESDFDKRTQKLYKEPEATPEIKEKEEEAKVEKVSSAFKRKREAKKDE